MAQLILLTSQGRGSAEQHRAYPIETAEAGQEAWRELYRASVLAGEEPVRFRILPQLELPVCR